MVIPKNAYGGALCVVCKQPIRKGESRQLDSAAGRKKGLSDLLFKYGDINIIEGVICRTCERKLVNLDNSVTEFKKACQGNLHLLSIKSGLADINNTADTNKRQTPIKSSFPIIEDTEQSMNDSGANLSSACLVMPVGLKTPILIRKKTQVTTTPAHSSVEQQKENLLNQNFSPIMKLHTPDRFISSTGTSLNTPDSTNDHGHNDHPYTSTKSVKTKQGKSRLVKKHHSESDYVQEFLTNQHEQGDDFLSNEEISGIFGQLPFRSRSELIKVILQHKEAKTVVEDYLINEITNKLDFLKNRKHGKVSVLMTKDHEDLKNFNWKDVLQELYSECPFLLRVFLAVLVPIGMKEEQKLTKVADNVPRLGMAYAILAQGRNMQLSKVQRVVSTILFDNICDQKVFDHLQLLGVSLCYGGGIQQINNWHVRTKRNIERVRRDEEKAAEEEKEKQRRIALAEQEARTDLLRQRAKKRAHEEIESGSGTSVESELPLPSGSGTSVESELPLPSGSGTTDIYTASGHINFFREVESGELKSGKNAEYEAEKKAEKEKWEKDIGLLTYLGQSSIESQAAPPWYLAPKKRKEKDEAEMAYVKDKKLKDNLDPLKQMEVYLHKKKHKHKDKEKDKHGKQKRKHKSKERDPEDKKQHSSQTKSIEQLRAERLKREQEEKRRTQELLSKGKGQGSGPEPESERPESDRERRYNSQFNPDFVRQPRHSYEF